VNAEYATAASFQMSVYSPFMAVFSSHLTIFPRTRASKIALNKRGTDLLSDSSVYVTDRTTETRRCQNRTDSVDQSSL
jgi:hypothetical protein